MKAKNIIKISLVSVLVLGLTVYFIYAMTAMSTNDPTQVCDDIVFNIEQNPRANFIDKSTIEAMLKSSKLYPKGKLMTDIDTRQIENTLKGNNFIKNVECYKSTSSKLCIDIIQRTPVIYILPDNANGYFVDEEGKIIANTSYSSNILIATGNIDPNYATSKLAQFGKFIQDNSFWDNQLEQVCVSLDRDSKRVVQLIPRVGEHVIYMGCIDNYEKKLNRLKTFYTKAMGTVGWNKYKKINLEYNNQIICTKHKN